MPFILHCTNSLYTEAMSEKNRIEKVMLHLNMTSGQFAAEIGVQNSTLSHILNNRNNPSLDVLKKILSRFPEVSTDWLILGQGSMLRQEFNSKEPTLFDSEEEDDSLSAGLGANYVPESSLQNRNNQNEMLKSELNLTSPAQSGNAELNSSKLISSPGVGTTASANKELPGETTTNNQIAISSLPPRKATKVIIYYTDNTFQEFDSK